MSAIAGIFRTDGRRVERRDLERMSKILAHRGRDGSGVWNTGSIGLAHQLLWTTPESLHEHLPRMRSESNLVVTADVRLDNRADLIGQLGLTGVPAADVTDSELILRAYERWEEDCASYLLGDFAFAIWDARRNRLYCARDHIGVKPLFYFHQPGQAFVFASEIKALRAATGVPSRLNEQAVADHLLLHYFDATSTYYEEIVRLPPAHYVIVTPEKTRLQRYWSLDPSRELRLSSDGEYAEAFRHLLTEAVRARMRSAFPVGSMLSGGLDSSSITCLARNLDTSNNGSRGWPTFSAVHDVVTECDESRYINAVLARGGYEPSLLQADRVSPLCDVDKVLWHQDEPLLAGNLYLNWGLYRQARERGTRVVLDGYDGDTTVSHGLGYLVELARSDRWLRLASEVVPFARKIGEPWAQALWSWLWRYELDPLTARTPGVARIRRWAGSRLSSRLTSSADRSAEWLAIFNDDFAKRVDPAGRRRAVSGVAPTTEREAHHRRLSDAGVPHTLEVLDRAAGAFALEARFPFWDRRLVEFCLSLPPEQKLRHGWTRMVLRRGMDGILPPMIQWRGGKTDHHAGFERGMLTFERELLNRIVYDDSDVVAPYVDVAALRQQFARSLSPARSDATFNVVWVVVSLALWLRHANLGTNS
jgi:asparagine synthase (glutamine-hydrolysing)